MQAFEACIDFIITSSHYLLYDKEALAIFC